MDYQKNVELAISLGFKEISSEKSFRGKLYVKDKLKWIHDIEALKTSLNIEKNGDLKEYDVRSYYYYVGYRNGVVDRELALELIKATIHSDNSVLSGRFSLLKNERILDGMISLFCEGHSEEVLSNYAIQMTKKYYESE